MPAYQHGGEIVMSLAEQLRGLSKSTPKRSMAIPRDRGSVLLTSSAVARYSKALSDGPKTVAELCGIFGCCRQAVHLQLQKMHRAGLVVQSPDLRNAKWSLIGVTNEL